MLCARIQLDGVDLSGTQTVVAEYGFWGVRVDQHSHDSDAFLALLNRKTLKVVVKLLNPRGEGLAVMAAGIEQLLFKHVLIF